MVKTIAGVACAALLLSGVACKKDTKSSGKTDKAEKSGKTAEPTEKDKMTPPEPAKAKLDTPEDKLAFYKGCVEALNAKDMDKFGACYTEDAVADHVDSGMPPMTGRAAIVEGLQKFQTATPDMHVAPTMIFVSGNKIASVVVVNGTNSGPLTMGDHEMAATNKKFGLMQLHMVEVNPAAGGVSKEWLVADMGTFMGQLGMNPQPVRAVMEPPTGEPTVVIAKDDDTEKANIEVYKKSVELWEKHDAKGLAALSADNLVAHDYSMPKDTGKKEMTAMMNEIMKAFPDAKGEVLDIFAAGDYVVAIAKNSGTNKGPMPSMKLKKPTNKAMSFTGVDVIKMQGGKAVEQWSFYNGMAIAMQLGLLPPMPAAGGAEGAEGGKMTDEGANDKGADMKPDMKDKKPAPTEGEGGAAN